MKRYICGLCKDKKNRYNGDRKGLRDHLKKEHLIVHNIANIFRPKETQGNKGGNAATHQRWWIVEEIE